MIEQCVSLLGTGLVLTLLAFVRALPLLVIALLATLLLRRRLAARYQFLLWMVVCIRMLMPFSVPSPISIHGPLEQFAIAMISGTSRSESPQPYQFSEDIQTNSESSPQTISEFMDMPRREHSLPQTPPAPSIDWEFVVAAGVLSLWSLGVVLLLSRGVIAHVRFALQVRNCPPIEDHFVRSLLLEECDSVGLRRPKVVEAAFLHSPAVFGFWKPTICLPMNLAAQLSEQELRWVLRHELAHIKRRDSLWLSIAFFMQAVHWFNPLAWLVSARLQALAEESADDVAVRNSQQDTWTDYARMLLHFAEEGGPKHSRATVGLLCMASASGLPKRIEMLVQRRPSKRFVLRASAGLAIIGLAVVGLTDQMVVADAEYYVESDSSEAAQELVSIHASARRDEKGTTSPRSRNVEELLVKLKDEFGVRHPQSFLLELVQSQSQLPASIEDGKLMIQLSDAGMLEVDNMLTAMMQTGPRHVMVDCRVWQGEFPQGNSLSWFNQRVETTREGDQYRPVAAAKITKSQIDQFIQAAPGVVLSAPKIQLYNGTTGTIVSGQERPFVTDVTPLAPNVQSPVISTILEGWEIQVQALVTKDEACDLKCVLSDTNVDEVRYAHLSFLDAVPSEQKTTVQVPIVNRSVIRAEATIGPDEHLLIAIPTLNSDDLSDRPDAATFYLISPRAIPLEDTSQVLRK